MGEGRYRGIFLGSSTERCVVSGGKRRRIGVLMGSWRVMFGIAGRRRRARACVSGRGGVTVRAAAAALFFGLFVVFLGLGPCFCPRLNFCAAFFAGKIGVRSYLCSSHCRGSVVHPFAKPAAGSSRLGFLKTENQNDCPCRCEEGPECRPSVETSEDAGVVGEGGREDANERTCGGKSPAQHSLEGGG